MKRVPKRGEHIETFLGSYASSKNGQHLPQGLSREANSNISIAELYFTHGQANNLALRKAETRATKITRYKTCQVRRQRGIYVNLVFNGARSQQKAGNLSFWYKKRRGACSGSLTICSLILLKTKQHLILSKSFLD